MLQGGAGTCPLPPGPIPVNMSYKHRGEGSIPLHPSLRPLSPCGHVTGGAEGLSPLGRLPVARLQGGFVALTGIPVLPAVS